MTHILNLTKIMRIHKKNWDISQDYNENKEENNFRIFKLRKIHSKKINVYWPIRTLLYFVDILNNRHCIKMHCINMHVSKWVQKLLRYSLLGSLIQIWRIVFSCCVDKNYNFFTHFVDLFLQYDEWISILSKSNSIIRVFLWATVVISIIIHGQSFVFPLIHTVYFKINMIQIAQIVQCLKLCLTYTYISASKCMGWYAWPEVQTYYKSVLRKFCQL